MKNDADKMESEEELTSNAEGESTELSFWKGALWWIWGFTVGLIIGA